MKGYFEFYNPVKICAGEDALGNLLYEVQNLGMRRPLLLTDETLTRLIAGKIRAYDPTYYTVIEVDKSYISS